jgi:hypothetical protein
MKVLLLGLLGVLLVVSVLLLAVCLALNERMESSSPGSASTSMTAPIDVAGVGSRPKLITDRQLDWARYIIVLSDSCAACERIASSPDSLSRWRQDSIVIVAGRAAETVGRLMDRLQDPALLTIADLGGEISVGQLGVTTTPALVRLNGQGLVIDGVSFASLDDVPRDMDVAVPHEVDPATLW